MTSLVWWIRQIVFMTAAVFFLLFGVQLLIAAYRLENPLWFVMTFFASNLIVLISAAVLIGLVIRALPSRRREKED